MQNPSCQEPLSNKALVQTSHWKHDPAAHDDIALAEAISEGQGIPQDLLPTWLHE